MATVTTDPTEKNNLRSQLCITACATIEASCLIGFSSSIDWAQWCRELANAAFNADEAKFNRLVSVEQQSFSVASEQQSDAQEAISQC